MSARQAAAMFEQAAADSAKVKTNAKVKTVKAWTPNAEGAHTQPGYARQTAKVEVGGPPPKRSLADLP